MQSPVPSSAGVSLRMQRQLRVGTQPELALRRMLHARGFRYRVAWPVPGRPRRTIDMAFTKKKFAIFVDGCFWHSCPVHGTSPQANSVWWADKLRRNVERDQDTDAVLRGAGWTVLRIWEHEPTLEATVLVERALIEADLSRSPG